MTAGVATFRAQLDEALDEMHQLHSIRYVWKNLLAMLSAPTAPPPNALVNGWLSVCYTRTLAIGIRRQAEASDTRSTIGSLLRRARAHHTLLTADACGFAGQNVEARWMRYASSIEHPADAAKLQLLIDNVGSQGAVALRWANKRIAHLDHQPAEVTFTDLEAALEALRDAARYLYGLLNGGATLTTLTPLFGPEWMETFAQPWYDKEHVTPVDPETLG